jgi:hypothetical protein
MKKTAIGNEDKLKALTMLGLANAKFLYRKSTPDLTSRSKKSYLLSESLEESQLDS